MTSPKLMPRPKKKISTIDFRNLIDNSNSSTFRKSMLKRIRSNSKGKNYDPRRS